MVSAALDVVGVQTPRFLHTPRGVVENRAAAAVELMAAVGMPLDPWQVTTLESWLGVRPDGGWAAARAGIVVARQNGKNAVLEARELAGLFLFGEHRIVHSAHQAATAEEAFKRMRNILEATPWLEAEVSRMIASPGRHAIHLKNGAELSYRTRTKGGARGFSAPVVVLDEAQELSGEQQAAITPLVSSFPSHQLIYTGTVLAGASIFQGLVQRGRQQVGDALGYVEWSAPEDCDPSDLGAWLQANPSVGFRMTVDAIRNEWEEFSAAGTVDKFREERLSIWPDVASAGQMIPVPAWTACFKAWTPPADQVVDYVGIASSVDGAWSAVGVAFEHEGRTAVRLAAFRAGTDWVIPYVQGLVERRRPRMVVMDKGGPASKSLANGLTAVLPRGVLAETSTAEMQQATAQFVDAVMQGRVWQSGQPELDAAAGGVREKLVGDARMFDRRKSRAVIAPVEAVTLAAWGLLKAGPVSKYETGELLVL